MDQHNSNSNSMNDDGDVSKEKKDVNSNDDLSNELSNMNIDTHGSSRHRLCCLKVVKGSSRCSKCRTALYCSRECQVKHWPVHKNNCQDSNTENSIQKLEMKAMNNIKQGKYHKAEKLYTKLLKQLRVQLGESHVSTLNTMSNVATACDQQGKHFDAEVMFKQSLDKMKKVLEENHLDTLITMNNLANTYSSQGKYSDAEVLYKQCLDKRMVVHGESHPDTKDLSLLINY